ncbi:GntR family transcriptional regulator [Sphingomonas colocasiae]|uniref:GntR family transcriptional regulator n=1 Tax=Sphingomonas colocasiae TaxID=1848973 RepID=A0ABS7PVS5_9SPHN|nr:GntR family transcriptional regulator [Sphingomonas colocasiae]MBY8824477.1 GntR family transcriptional regulator [Sphingomonas colocasiae]
MPEAPIKGDGPKYREIYDRLRGEIDAGSYAAGSLLPTEDELQADLGVSRYALREALGMLERQGYIQRRRRAGTRVLARPPKNMFRHAVSSRGELSEFVHHTKIDFGPPTVIVTDGRLARELGCDELRQWYLMEGIRMDPLDNRPIGVVQLYVDATRATIDENTDFGQQPVYEWLRDNHDIRPASVSQDITAVILNETQATVFGEREGGPALRIARRYFDDTQRIFQISVTTHRSEDFVYNLRLQLA